MLVIVLTSYGQMNQSQLQSIQSYKLDMHEKSASLGSNSPVQFAFFSPTYGQHLKYLFKGPTYTPIFGLDHPFRKHKPSPTCKNEKTNTP